MGGVDFIGFLNASKSGRAVVDAIERLAEPAEYTDRDDIARGTLVICSVRRTVCAGCRQAAGNDRRCVEKSPKVQILLLVSSNYGTPGDNHFWKRNQVDF